MKHRNRMRFFASMTNTAAPFEVALAEMTQGEAAQWLHARWGERVGHGLGCRQQ